MSRIRLPFAFIAFLVAGPLLAAEPRLYVEATHGEGELRYVNGLPVLTVAGTPEEIGGQVAALAAAPMDRLLHYPQRMFRAAGWNTAWPYLLRLSNSMEAHFPSSHRRELETIATRAKLDHDLAVAGNTLPDIMKIAGCSTLVVEPGRSATGAPLFGRNLDYPTLGFLQRYTLVTVYRPVGKHAFVSVGFPGMVGCISGMNDAGLALAVLEVYKSRDGSPRLDPQGTVSSLCYRRVLEECTTVAEAERLLRSMHRTTYNNLALCDRQGGAVFEITPRTLAVRRGEAGLCGCTNHFRTPGLATASPGDLASSRNCRRYPKLVDAPTGPNARLAVADVAARLHAVSQKQTTLQTMIFEPAALRLHLAAGQTPSSALPLQTLDLAPLFTGSVEARR